MIYREGNKDDLKNLQIFLILKFPKRVGGMNFGLRKCGLSALAKDHGLARGAP
jgi:hypothetical protein